MQNIIWAKGGFEVRVINKVTIRVRVMVWFWISGFSHQRYSELHLPHNITVMRQQSQNVVDQTR